MTDEKAIEAAYEAAIAYSDTPDFYPTRRMIEAAIAAYLAQREADGFVMVPVEPTPHMKEEALFANDNALLMSADCTDMGNAYRAMIAARPKGDV
jgi:hypothetical protein